MKKNLKIIDKKTLYSGFFELHQFTIKHKKHNGSWSEPLIREIFSGGHVATVLPYDPIKKRIILISSDGTQYTILQDDFPGDLVAKCGLPITNNSKNRCIATIVAELIVEDDQLILKGKEIKQINASIEYNPSDPYTIKYLKSNNSQKGIAIVMVMLIMAVLALSSSSIFYLSSAFNEGSLQSKLRQQTQYAAEAGLQEGLRWLESRAVIGGHWSIENDADPIQVNDLEDQEKKCLGSFGYIKDEDDLNINTIFHANRIGPKRMRSDVTEAEDNLKTFRNFILIQKTAENFFMLQSNIGVTPWPENQLHRDPRTGSAHIFSEFGNYLDASDVGTSLTEFTLEFWIMIPSYDVAEAALAEDHNLFYLIDGDQTSDTPNNKITIINGDIQSHSY